MSSNNNVCIVSISEIIKMDIDGTYLINKEYLKTNIKTLRPFFEKILIKEYRSKTINNDEIPEIKSSLIIMFDYHLEKIFYYKNKNFIVVIPDDSLEHVLKNFEHEKIDLKELLKINMIQDYAYRIKQKKEIQLRKREIEYKNKLEVEEEDKQDYCNFFINRLHNSTIITNQSKAILVPVIDIRKMEIDDYFGIYFTPHFEKKNIIVDSVARAYNLKSNAKIEDNPNMLPICYGRSDFLWNILTYMYKGINYKLSAKELIKICILSVVCKFYLRFSFTKDGSIPIYYLLSDDLTTIKIPEHVSGEIKTFLETEIQKIPSLTSDISDLNKYYEEIFFDDNDEEKEIYRLLPYFEEINQVFTPLHI